MIPHGSVLVVDDDPDRAQQIAQLLTFLGYKPYPYDSCSCSRAAFSEPS